MSNISNKVLDKSVYKSLKKKGLMLKGDYYSLAKLCVPESSRYHIKTVIENQGTTTQHVIDTILKFFNERIESLKNQKEEIKNIIN